MSEKIKIILDTDIADDIDDAIALLFALGSPEFELLGVTTVYGDVDTRTRVARKVLRTCGRGDVPAVAGFERPLGFDYHPGTLPEPCSQRQAVAGDDEPLDRSRGAAEFIAETVRRHPGEVHVLTIGAMTNLAAAICMDASLVGKIAGVVSLAGYLPPRESRPEWNVRYDPLAAQCLGRSGVRWTAIGADVQGDNHLTQREFQVLRGSGLPCTELLLELVVLMKRNKGGGDPSVKGIEDVGGAHVADVMALASFLVPGAMSLTSGRVEVNEGGGVEFRPQPNGPHRFALSSLPAGAYRGEIVRRLLTAGGESRNGEKDLRAGGQAGRVPR